MYTKTKADGTLAKKPGPKKKEQPVISAEQAKDEEVKAPDVRVKVETAQDVAWRRIYELAAAIHNIGDEKLVMKWANEITWQCTIIEAMNDDGQG